MVDEPVARRELEESVQRLEQAISDQAKLLDTKISGVIETSRTAKESAEKTAVALAQGVESTRSQLAQQLSDTTVAMATATEKVSASSEKRIQESSAQSNTQLTGLRNEMVLRADATEKAVNIALASQQDANGRVDTSMAHILERIDMHPNARDVSQALMAFQDSHTEMHRGLQRTLETIEPHSAHDIWRAAHAVEHNHLQEGIHIAEQDGKDDLRVTMDTHQKTHDLTTAAQRDADERKRDADSLANSKLDIRLGEMNNLRQSLDRAQSMFVSRDQLEDMEKSIVNRIDVMERVMAGDQGRQQGTIRLLGMLSAVLGLAIPVVFFVLTRH